MSCSNELMSMALHIVLFLLPILIDLRLLELFVYSNPGDFNSKTLEAKLGLTEFRWRAGYRLVGLVIS